MLKNLRLRFINCLFYYIVILSSLVSHRFSFFRIFSAYWGFPFCYGFLASGILVHFVWISLISNLALVTLSVLRLLVLIREEILACSVFALCSDSQSDRTSSHSQHRLSRENDRPLIAKSSSSLISRALVHLERNGNAKTVCV